jgi:ubiquinone/menaquinone biosynthesis C-methylase UbiE
MSMDRRRIRPLASFNPSLRWGDVPHSVAPFVPSPPNVVQKMLQLGEAGPDDTLYDLGCGDGRILFTAVEEFNVKQAVGYDLNASMCEATQKKINDKGLKDRIKVVNGNFFHVNLSPATFVTLYLTTSGNSKLRPKMEEELREGSRVVSHDFPIHDWTTVKAASPAHYIVGSHKIFVYQVPEAFKKYMTILKSLEETSSLRRIREFFRREDESS